MTKRGIDAVLAHLAKLPPPESLTLAEQRAQYERAERAFPIPADVAVERVVAPVAPAEWLVPPSARADTVVLYLHGGGYVIGSPRSHRHLAAAIARAARARAVVLEYRLAPEHPFPAALEDAVDAYQWLLAQGIAPARVAIAGDSAGGGLTVATLVALRERGLPLPAAGVAISPWVDLTCSAPSYAKNAAADPIVRPAIVAEMARAYLGPVDPRTPLASPLFADLSGLPPLLIHVGSGEVLLDDATRLAERLKAAGVAARLEIVPRMVHVWHWFLPMLDEAQTAVDDIGAFVNAQASPRTVARR
jgi:phosphinothricin tripeptide acetyl hydrolase